MGFILSNNRYEEIKKIVVDTIIKLDISHLPISGFEMASKLGAVVVPYSSKPEDVQLLLMKESKDGFSEMHNGKWYIFYNDKKVYGRINHTLLHECGHIVFNHSNSSDLAEVEANFFAKYAIAPPVLIHILHLKNSDEVYNNFYISHQASEIAYNYYGKWLMFGESDYTDYEKNLLQHFNFAV